MRIKTRTQESRAISERRANEKAHAARERLPYPNPWDDWDPTKLDPSKATPEAIHARYVEFCKLCPRDRRRRHSL
jgi:hypothetical protein